MKLNIGKILTRTWEIVWKHRVLWIFGVFASFAERTGGNFNSNSSNKRNDLPFSPDQFSNNAGDFFQQYMVIIIAVACVIILLSLLFFALGMIGRIGMIKGTYRVEKGADQLVFAEIWSESLPYFWRFFLLNFLFGLAFAVIIIPAVLIGVLTAGIGFACVLPLLCLMIPVAWLASMVIEQAQAAMVLEDASLMDALRRGWEIFRANIGDLVVMSIILGIGGGIIGFVIAIPVIISLLPLFFSFAEIQSGSFPTMIWISLGCCALYFPVLILLNGILTAYKKSAWTLTFIQITKPVDENTPVELQANA